MGEIVDVVVEWVINGYDDIVWLGWIDFFVLFEVFNCGEVMGIFVGDVYGESSFVGDILWLLFERLGYVNLIG